MVQGGTYHKKLAPNRAKCFLDKKKLTFISHKVMQEVRIQQHSTSATIAARIFEICKFRKMKIGLKNVK